MMMGLALLAVAVEIPDTRLYQEALSKHVNLQGGVRYAALNKDLGPLNRFVEQLAQVSPDSHPALFPSREAKLAHWLNTYNALVVWAFAQEYPAGKTRLANKVGQFNFFYRRKFTVGGRERSLDDIETNSIRKAFGDPRIHFALVCASASCPWLSPVAYTAGNVELELEKRTQLFVSQARNVEKDSATGRVTLSMIFRWYEGDFGGREKLLAFLEQRRPGLTAHAAGKTVELRYRPYDWSLNEEPTAGSDPAHTLGSAANKR
ncbi:MAG: DUF547 domain-containing protein [Acidobacteria bacterium]|nr:DUF547 domain-containing protein [Acidobacteriota bacterium]